MPPAPEQLVLVACRQPKVDGRGQASAVASAEKMILGAKDDVAEAGAHVQNAARSAWRSGLSISNV